MTGFDARGVPFGWALPGRKAPTTSVPYIGPADSRLAPQSRRMPFEAKALAVFMMQRGHVLPKGFAEDLRELERQPVPADCVDAEDWVASRVLILLVTYNFLPPEVLPKGPWESDFHDSQGTPSAH